MEIEYNSNEFVTVPQGSICVNGVSLTVAHSEPTLFKVCIIPYTYEHTNFNQLQVGNKVNLEFDILGNFFRPHWERMRDVFNLGWPISVTTIFEGMLFNACVFLMAAIGTNELAAYQVALNAAAMAFMLPFGFAMGGCVRIGLAAGAGNSAAVQRVGLATITVCIILIMMFAALTTLAPNWIADVYLSASDGNNAAVRELVLSFLPIAAAFMLFDAAQVAANQLLRGLKDVKVPMIMTGVSYWVIGFPTALYLGLFTPVGAVGIWYGLLAGLAAASVLLGARFWQLAWRAPIAGQKF